MRGRWSAVRDSLRPGGTPVRRDAATGPVRGGHRAVAQPRPLLLSVLTLGCVLAASCGGRVPAARAAPGGPPLSAAEPAADAAASGAIRADTGGTIEVTDARSPLAGAPASICRRAH